MQENDGNHTRPEVLTGRFFITGGDRLVVVLAVRRGRKRAERRHELGRVHVQLDEFLLQIAGTRIGLLPRVRRRVVGHVSAAVCRRRPSCIACADDENARTPTTLTASGNNRRGQIKTCFGEGRVKIQSRDTRYVNSAAGCHRVMVAPRVIARSLANRTRTPIALSTAHSHGGRRCSRAACRRRPVADRSPTDRLNSDPIRFAV